MRQLLNFLAILAAFAINVYTNLAPPSGRTIGEISNTKFAEVIIIPANYAFAIWGLIYLALIGFAIYQALPNQRNNPYLGKIGYLLVISNLAQIAWVFLFSYQLVTLSVVAMLAIWFPLLMIYLRIGYKRVSKQNRRFIHDPISLYFAWISVATIVNIAIALYQINWSGWGLNDQMWTVIMLSIAAFIAAIANITRLDTAFLLVVVWALVAIAVHRADMLIIVTTAGALALALLLLLLLQILRPSSDKESFL